ncbi:unnamed protein product [Mesocestoides corti]|uniref:Aminopeptidase P N-terminal domain-containing protein n=1 Tax=Mesocestoides corti TaxID=53468 RepID=A0A0R3UBG5_MESCO|nr:unnamed protein product [Mesocestoides corti]
MKMLDSSDRLAALRQEMQKRHLDAFILPMEDSHFSEYLAAIDKRIAYISGFTGSAGTAVITVGDKAALWTDGRYHCQACLASRELDSNWILMREGLPDVPTIPSWLSQVTPPSGCIGFDPHQLPLSTVRAIQRELDVSSTEASSRRSLVPLEDMNLVDLVWQERPSRQSNPIRVVPVESFAGQSWEQKLSILRERLKSKGASALVIFQMDEIAWLFNLRGSDIKFNPLFFSYAVVTMDTVHLFVDWKRGPNSVDFEEYLRSPSHPVVLHPYDEFCSWLTTDSSWCSGRVWLPIMSSYFIACAVPEDQRLFDFSPVASLKAIKNPTEIEGMRIANLVDSLALCDFLAWLDDVSQAGKMDPTAVTPCDVPGVSPPTSLNEASLAAYLDAIRLTSDGCHGLSFPTIPGADSNGAVIHYSVSENSEGSEVTANSLFLVDSGGQYATGTTDVTRTVHLGTPSEEQITDYTQVLKAHACLASLTFPDNTAGTRLDVVCRASMWRSQRDYAHGTGHGVGANLCVHEGPIGLSGRRSQASFATGIGEPGIRKNMIVTIEPGYYLNDKYGIRLENVVLVVDCASGSRESPVPFLGFEALTMVPFQRRLIDRSALLPAELAWLNAYHATVRERLLGQLKVEQRAGSPSAARKRTRDWILRETEPL